MVYGRANSGGGLAFLDERCAPVLHHCHRSGAGTFWRDHEERFTTGSPRPTESAGSVANFFGVPSSDRFSGFPEYVHAGQRAEIGAEHHQLPAVTAPPRQAAPSSDTCTRRPGVGKTARTPRTGRCLLTRTRSISRRARASRRSLGAARREASSAACLPDVSSSYTFCAVPSRAE